MPGTRRLGRAASSIVLPLCAPSGVRGQSRAGAGSGVDTTGPSGPINGVVFGDSIASGLASRLVTARPGDTWNEVSQANFGLNDTFGSGAGSGAIGTGANSFKVKGHDVFYSGGARNVVVFISIIHRDVQDIRDANTSIMSRFKTLVDEARALGWYICAVTVPATTEYNDPGGSPYTRPNRIAINDALRSGGLGQPIRAGADYLANTDSISGFDQGDLPTSGNGAPLLADGIHLSNTGKDAVVAVISAAIP